MLSRLKPVFVFLFYIVVLAFIGQTLWEICGPDCRLVPGQKLILSLSTYNDTDMPTIMDRLRNRLEMQPFNIVATMIFIGAILHTFVCHYFTVISKRIRDRNRRLGYHPIDSFSVEFFRFMGEVEVVFGVWVIPLFICMVYFYDWPTAVKYMDEIDYTEPMFVVVIMSLAATKPIVKVAEDLLRFVAHLGNQTVTAWWWAILTIGPLSGSLITEPGAMTISALILSKKFYDLKPTPRFSYATLGLLFTNISVGGVFTNFAAPPVLMVAKAWKWGTPYMVQHFGWKSLLGIVIANLVYFLCFRHEFKDLERRRKEMESKKESKAKFEPKIPFWISIVHMLFLAWTVAHNHHPVIFVGTFLLFMGFYQATLTYQKDIALKPAILVGFFLGGLVVHGNLQGWWIEPFLGKAGDATLMVLSMFLTSFNDNASITFLATLIPGITESMKYAVVAGAVTGGGLTVIANAPNPSGQAILGKYFYQGVSAISLLAAAIVPATLIGFCFYLLKAI